MQGEILGIEILPSKTAATARRPQVTSESERWRRLVGGPPSQSAAARGWAVGRRRPRGSGLRGCCAGQDGLHALLPTDAASGTPQGLLRPSGQGAALSHARWNRKQGGVGFGRRGRAGRSHIADKSIVGPRFDGMIAGGSRAGSRCAVHRPCGRVDRRIPTAHVERERRVMHRVGIPPRRMTSNWTPRIVLLGMRVSARRVVPAPPVAGGRRTNCRRAAHGPTLP